MATQTLEIRVLDKTATSLKNISQRVTALNKGLLGVNRVAGLAATALGAIGGASIIRRVVSVSQRFEDLRTTLNSVTGSANQGAQAFEFISNFSTKTQFGIEDLTNTFVKLKTAGIEPTEELLTTFTDAAAVTTDQIGSLQAITDLFSRTVGGGLGLEELERLGDRGVPVLTILRDKLGLARDQISEFGKSAEGARKITEALGEGIREQFGGATEARLNNLSTSFSNFNIALDIAADKLAQQGFSMALGDLTKEITNLITENDEFVVSIGTKLTKAFLFTVEAVKLVIQNMDILITVFGIFFGLKIVAGLTAVALAFGSTLARSILIATRAVKMLTLAAKANPLILGASLAVAGAAMLSDEFDKFLNKVGVTDEMLKKVTQGIEDFVPDPIQDIGLAIDHVVTSFGEVDKKVKDIEARLRELRKAAEKATDTQTEGNDKTVESLTEAEKAYKTLLISINGVVEKNALNAETAAIVQQKFDEGTLTLEVYEGMMKKLSKTFETATEKKKKDADALDALKSKLQSSMETYRSFTHTIEESAREAADADIAIFQQALDKNLISQEKFNELRDAANKSVAQTIMEQELELANKLADIEDQKLKKAKEAMDARVRAVVTGQSKILSAEDIAVLQKQGQEKKIEDRVRERTEFEQKSELEKVNFGIGQGKRFFEALGKQNKQFFAAMKAFAIAEAIINTYQGATKALATYPPPFNFIAAAAVVAGGLAQVATIRSTQYSGRQRGGDVKAGQLTMVGEDGPEMLVPKRPSTVIPREVAEAVQGMGGNSQPVNVNFNINTVDARDFDDLLVERRATITGIINNAMRQQGRMGVV